MQKLITGVDLKDTKMIDERLLINVPKATICTMNGEVIIQERNSDKSPFKGKSFVLTSLYDWEIGIDADGATILVPTKKI